MDTSAWSSVSLHALNYRVGGVVCAESGDLDGRDLGLSAIGSMLRC